MVGRTRTARATLGRREFLRLSLLTTATIAASACAQPPAPAKPEAAKPAADPTRPAAPTGAAAQPTQAAAAATAAPAPAKPAVASSAASDKPGRHLIGTLEGPEILMDAKRPAKLAEAPMLAELVRAGTLPPVEQRVPEEPLVIKPLHGIGKYGGTWRRGFTGAADGENGNRIVSTDRLLFSDYTGNAVVPSVARAGKMSDDGKTFTLTLRKGMKWSDGQPFTADDILFWYQDLYSDKEVNPVPAAEMFINGKPGTVEKVDELTVAYKFPEPYYLFEQIMGGDSKVGAGFAGGGTIGYGPFMGGYAPAHYLKQYLPKYTPQDTLDQMVKEAGFDTWRTLLIFKTDWQRNPELPVLTPWKTTSPINTPQWILERNPYYYEVDTDGNQLPYVDKIVMTLAENLEVLNLRAMAGEYDVQGRHEDLSKLPVLLENQQRGNYTVRLDPADYGADAVVFANMSYEGDPEIARWLRMADFRRALSLGIDRDQLNETFWMGLGTPGSTVVGEHMAENPGKEYRTLWSTLDVARANELLDKAGLSQKDSEGFRLRTDNGQRLRLDLLTPGAAFLPLTQIGEMIRAGWRKIGVDVNVVELERGLHQRRVIANEHQMSLKWGNTGTEIPFVSTFSIIPTHDRAEEAPLYGKWYASGGQAGTKPEDPLLIKAMEMFRAAFGQKQEDRIAVAQEIWRMHIDQQWTIGTVGLGPAILGVRVVKNTLGNVPQRLSINRNTRTPGASHPATYFFKA